MANEKSAIEEFLGDIGKAKENPFESADPFAPQEEVKEQVEEEVFEEEKPLPFHKDPKVQRYVEKQIAKALEGVKPSEAQQFKESVSSDADDVVGAFTAIIGNDTPEKVKALEALKKTLSGVDERAASKAVERFQQQTQAELKRQQEEDTRAQEELDSSFEEIEDTYGVDLSSNTAQARKTRSDFVDYIRKIAPKDAEGEVVAFPDLSAAFEEFQERSKRVNPTVAKAKQLASRGMTTSTDATVVPKNTDKSWKAIDKLFGNLTS